MHIAAYTALSQKLLPVVEKFEKTLQKKSKQFSRDVKVGRTHLMEAVPVSFGQEFGGYAAQLSMAIDEIRLALGFLRELPLGGTAVGTGLNAPKKFDSLTVAAVARETGLPFIVAKNKFAHISGHEPEVIASSALKTLAIILAKIANDIRLGASGPHTGFADIEIPENEPGSSIMPGKVNPTQAEALLMVCAQVIGNDATISISGMNGQFQLNVSKPVIIHNLLQSITLLTDAVRSFEEKCILGVRVNIKKAKSNLDRSLMNVTALNTKIGYERAAKAVAQAKREGKTIREVIIGEKLLSETEYDRLVDYRKMI
jgi:fumarate hydratase class II